MLIQQHGGNFHISLTVQGRPAALSPPLSFGLVYTTVPGVLHCCLLSSGFCMFQPQPTREHMAHCVMMLLAAQRSAFTSGVHCTQDTRPSCPTDLRDTSAHLSLPLPFPSSHLGPIKQHYLQRAGTSHPSCCEVQHTPCCAARQHWPHWFYWGTTLPSVSLPNTWYNQSLLKQTKTFYHILWRTHTKCHSSHTASPRRQRSAFLTTTFIPLSLAPPALPAVGCAEQQRADSALKAQTLPWWLGSVHNSTAALGKPENT